MSCCKNNDVVDPKQGHKNTPDHPPARSPRPPVPAPVPVVPIGRDEMARAAAAAKINERAEALINAYKLEAIQLIDNNLRYPVTCLKICKDRDARIARINAWRRERRENIFSPYWTGEVQTPTVLESIGTTLYDFGTYIGVVNATAREDSLQVYMKNGRC